MADAEAAAAPATFSARACPSAASADGPVVVGSRNSPLALAQTRLVVDQLRRVSPRTAFRIETMTTTGDRILDKPLAQIGDKALFTKQLDEALRDHRVDLVVHSLKDIPTTLPPELVIGAVSARINPHDAVVLRTTLGKKTLNQLDEGSTLGTSSVRRVAQLRRRFPHLRFDSVRGNLNTRLKKLEDGDKYAGLVLAAAGLIRMGWEDKISQVLGPDECMHAVGQGALAVECRKDDEETLSLLAEINDTDTMLCCAAERAFMKSLEGGCSVPVGISSFRKDGQIHLKGGVFSLDGSEAVVESTVKKCESIEETGVEPPTKKLRKEEDSVRGSDVGFCCSTMPSRWVEDAVAAGESLAHTLLGMGAQHILARARKSQVT